MNDWHTLGLERGASVEALRSAFRRLALLHHPDRHTGRAAVDAAIRFKEISAAYGRITEGKGREDSAIAKPSQGDVDRYGTPDGAEATKRRAEEFADIMDAFFGRMGGFDNVFKGKQPKRFWNPKTNQWEEIP